MMSRIASYRYCIITLVASFLHFQNVNARGSRYIAVFIPDQSDGISGSFDVILDDSNALYADYSFNLDLSNFKNSGACNLAKGLDYHIHSWWDRSLPVDTVLSSFGTACDLTGPHYDPYLASYPRFIGATYNCTPELYQTKGVRWGCEVGDLSGKYGPVSVAQSSVRRNIAKDPMPPVVSDFTIPTGNWVVGQPYWNSVVFHCRAPTARLICAKFTLVSGPTPTQSNYVSGAEYELSLVLAVVLTFFGLLLILGILTLAGAIGCPCFAEEQPPDESATV